MKDSKETENIHIRGINPKSSPPGSSRFIYSEKKSPDNPQMILSEDLVNVKLEEINEE